MLGERFGLPWTSEPERLLEDPAIEAVSLAVPHHLHLEMATRAARAGKHVLLEKPFTLNVGQARELVEVGRECGVSIAPWLERRFLPSAERAREILSEGTLGSTVFTRVSALGYKSRAYWEHGMRCEEYPSSWRSRKETSGGGVLLMNGIHQVDLMAWVTGLEVADVFARTATLHHEVEVEDIALVDLRYRSGALGVIEAACCAYGVGRFPIAGPKDVVMGTDGFLELGSPLKCFDRIRFLREYELPRLSVADMKIRLLENFADHLRAGAPLRAGPADAIRALAVIEAAYDSAARRQPVEPAAI